MKFQRLTVALGALLLSGGLVCGMQAARADEFPGAVAQALRAAGVPLAQVAIVVQEVGASRPALALNPGTPMNPASTMKLVTTYAGLELLGPAWRWRTEAYLGGPLREGVLEGDLVLRGNGNPRLDYEAFWMLLRSLRGKGVREVRGDLVLDRSYFERSGGDAGRFDGDEFRPYNVLPDALLINYKSLRFSFMPEPERGTVRIAVQPRPPTLELGNTLKLAGDGPCPEGRAFRDQLRPVFESAPRPRASFSGTYPLSCGERDLHVALMTPNDYAAGVMRELWTETGGSWAGNARDGAMPAGARPFASAESPALSEIVRDINKFSNNVMARQLFLTLGAESAGPPARTETSARAIRQWLAAKGIPATELVMENGSGLSRNERISASTLVAMLQAAWRSPVMPEFIASMPLAAVDGTMRRRLKNDPVAGQAHVKTGLLSDVRAIAGYVLDRSGRRHAVVMVVNHANAHQTQQAQDALLAWVHQRAGRD